MSDNKKLAEDLLSLAHDKGAQEAEAYVGAYKSVRAESKEGEPSAIETAQGMAYSVRIIKDGRLGFSYSNSPSDIKSVVNKAVESAGFTEPDEYLSVASAQEGIACPSINTYDADIVALTAAEAIEYANLIEQSALEHKGDSSIKVRKASASFSESSMYIANSGGISAGFSATNASASISLAAERDGDSQMGWGHSSGRWLKDVDFKAAGAEGALRAISMLGATSPEAGNYPLLLDSSVAVDFLSVMSSMLSADNVQKQKSLLAGLEGQRVMSPLISITDNPLLPGIPSMRPMDAEGLPARSNVLIESGELKGFMHNTYTANKADTLSTGNAVRGGAATLAGVGSLGLYFDAPESAKTDKDELIASIDSGLLVTDAMGVHTINPISGEFSIGVSGQWIHNGKLSHPVKEAVISGKILDLFSSVEALGTDLRFYGAVGSPSLLVKDIRLSA